MRRRIARWLPQVNNKKKKGRSLKSSCCLVIVAASRSREFTKAARPVYWLVHLLAAVSVTQGETDEDKALAPGCHRQSWQQLRVECRRRKLHTEWRSIEYCRSSSGTSKCKLYLNLSHLSWYELKTHSRWRDLIGSGRETQDIRRHVQLSANCWRLGALGVWERKREGQWASAPT